MIRVSLVSDIRTLREFLIEALDAEDDIEVVDSARFREASVARLLEVETEVVVVDVTLPEGIDLIRKVARNAPMLKLVAFAVPEAERSIVPLVEAGACGLVPQEARVEDIRSTVRWVHSGHALCSPAITAVLLKRLRSLQTLDGDAQALTPREIEIVQLLARGLSNKKIAGELHIEAVTVKNHIHRILRKLHVGNRSDAVVRAMAADLLGI